MENISPTIIWAIFGICLIILEIFTTTFFLLFFGISALIVAIMKGLFLDHLTTEIFLFAIIGSLGILVFRKKVVESFKTTASVRGDAEQLVVIDAPIKIAGTGTVMYQGVPWIAINNSDHDFVTGEEVLIERTDGIKLILKEK